MTRPTLLTTGLLAFSALAVPNAVDAQPRGKVYQVGYIQTASAKEQAHLTQAFEEGMRELGYVEGSNVVYLRRFADGDPKRLPDLAADLVRQNPDVIVTGSNPVVAAVMKATSTIPIVMTTSRDPVGSKLIANLNRPGGNVTGLTADAASGIAGKMLQYLKDMVPKATKVALLWNPGSQGAERFRSEIEDAARRLGVSVQVVEARGRDEFAAAFAAIARERADALVVHPDPVFFTGRAQVVELTTKHRLPAIFHARELVELGGLISYGSSLTDQFRRVGVYVDRILKGDRPGELAVRQPERYELVINGATAQALSLAIPPSLLIQADVIR